MGSSWLIQTENVFPDDFRDGNELSGIAQMRLPRSASVDDAVLIPVQCFGSGFSMGGRVANLVENLY
jgi:hypothetical protein